MLVVLVLVIVLLEVVVVDVVVVRLVDVDDKVEVDVDVEEVRLVLVDVVVEAVKNWGWPYAELNALRSWVNAVDRGWQLVEKSTPSQLMSTPEPKASDVTPYAAICWAVG